ncbi:hypothetical protein BS17DRAFT_771687 [Gyrodon lividus]|nr:hypothetical protein BS17DRAFT_771687 [Gyrodon lividus]
MKRAETAADVSWFLRPGECPHGLRSAQPFSHIQLPQGHDQNKKHAVLHVTPLQDPSLIMFTAKWYIALLLACLFQASLALPMAELAGRGPTEGPVADQFGGGGGGGPPDW